MINITTITCGYIYYNPFFVNHMASFGVNKNWAALIMTIPSFFCTQNITHSLDIANVNLVPRLQKHVKKTFLMSSALLICFVGNMLEAPFFGVCDSYVPVMIGLMFVGFA